MAPDASWDDTSAPPPPKKGLSTFGKVLIGCGGAMLCFILAVAALSWVVFTKASKAMDRGWAELRERTEGLRTEAGARRVYRDNPGLAQNYATEEDFVKASREWRGKLGDLPEQRPDFKALFSGRGPGSLRITTREAGGKKRVSIRMRMSNGALLSVELEDDKLTDIQVD